jgi:hypothetical protein
MNSEIMLLNWQEHLSKACRQKVKFKIYWSK